METDQLPATAVLVRFGVSGPFCRSTVVLFERFIPSVINITEQKKEMNQIAIHPRRRCFRGKQEM
jgi:hypothetical protein